MAERTSLASQTKLSDQAQPRSAEAIRQDIAAKRDAISDTVDRLGNRIQESLDWRSYAMQHPLAALGVAAGAGFVIAGIFKHRPSARDRMVDALAEVVEDFTDRVRGNLDDIVRRKNSGIGHAMKQGVAGLAAIVATEFVKRRAGSALTATSATGGRSNARRGVQPTDTAIHPSRTSPVRG